MSNSLIVSQAELNFITQFFPSLLENSRVQRYDMTYGPATEFRSQPRSHNATKLLASLVAAKQTEKGFERYADALRAVQAANPETVSAYVAEIRNR